MQQCTQHAFHAHMLDFAGQNSSRFPRLQTVCDTPNHQYCPERLVNDWNRFAPSLIVYVHRDINHSHHITGPMTPECEGHC